MTLSPRARFRERQHVYIKYCFFTGHIICAYICSIYHSSLLRYCLLCALFQHLVVSKLSRWTFVCHDIAWYAQHASPLSAIVIYRISLSLAGNELGNARSWSNHRKQNEWRRHLRSDLCFGSSGQRRTNILVARTYARWPLRASGLLDPLARTGPPSEKSRRASGQCRGLPSSHFACLSQVTSFQKLLHTCMYSCFHTCMK